MSILYPKSRIVIELQREIPVCLPIKRLVPMDRAAFTYIIPPISMRLFWLPFIASSML